MACKHVIPCPDVSPDVENALCRFIHDVMMYTLPICGLPGSGLPVTNIRRNIYRRPNLVNIAGVSALRIALIMRDTWKLMFESRRKNSGLTDKEIPTFLVNIVRCCLLTRDSTRQTMVEVLLAVCNEITMYFHSENIPFNSNTVIGSIGFAVVNIIGTTERVLEKVEMLFDTFENLGEYTRWILRFITKYAVPYGSRENVSSLFFDEVKNHHFKEILKIKAAIKVQPKTKSKAKPRPEPEDPSIKSLKDRLGFLPHHLYSAIVAEESVSLPENLLASGSVLPGDRHSPEPPILPPSIKKSPPYRRKSHGSKSSRSSKSSVESEHSVSGSTLPGDRDSPEPPILPPSTKKSPPYRRKSHGSKSSRSSKSSVESEHSVSGSTLPGDRDSPEPPILPPSPKKSPTIRRISMSSQSGKTSVESGHSGSGPVWGNQPPELPASSERGGLEKEALKSGTKMRTSDESKPILPSEQPKSHESSGGATADEGKPDVTRSGKGSEQTAQGQQSSRDSVEQSLDEELKRLSMNPKRDSYGSRGAIPKKRQPEK